ncbi:MAG: carbohydrate-binding family 9-like protein [Kiritimatiellia bacterium]|jgi:hypothetical protein
MSENSKPTLPILAAILAFLVAGCASPSRPPSRPSLVAVRLPDGGTSDFKSWEHVAKHPFMELGDYILRNPVQIAFAWDDDALYFHFEAQDDDIFNEAPDSITSGVFLWGDCIELFLQPEGERGYLEFHFTPAGFSGAIFFPSRGRRMPWDVKYIPMEGLSSTLEISGTLNDMSDTDAAWRGICRIPWNAIRQRFPNYEPGEPLRVQSTSIAYSIHSDGDEKSQLHHVPGSWADPHHLPNWSPLAFE